MKNFEVDDTLGFTLNKVNGKLKNELFKKTKAYDITAEQWGILNFLWDNEGITPKELSDLTLKDKPNTNRILFNLEKKGLVIRKEHPTDKRSYKMYLTDDGKNLRIKLVPIIITLLEQATRNLEKEKIEELKVTLNKIYINLS